MTSGVTSCAAAGAGPSAKAESDQSARICRRRCFMMPPPVRSSELQLDSELQVDAENEGAAERIGKKDHRWNERNFGADCDHLMDPELVATPEIDDPEPGVVAAQGPDTGSP